MTRQLVTIRKVTDVVPIEGVDAIELAKIDGLQCVVRKGDFVPGDFGVYHEIDSLLPLDNPAYAFLQRPGATKTHHRLKTIKLRGALSQGLLLRLSDPGLEVARSWFEFGPETEVPDLAAELYVLKYEPPQPGELDSTRCNPDSVEYVYRAADVDTAIVALTHRATSAEGASAGERARADGAHRRLHELHRQVDVVENLNDDQATNIRILSGQLNAARDLNDELQAELETQKARAIGWHGELQKVKRQLIERESSFGYDALRTFADAAASNIDLLRRHLVIK
jgi:hypothetical protein